MAHDFLKVPAAWHHPCNICNTMLAGAYCPTCEPQRFQRSQEKQMIGKIGEPRRHRLKDLSGKCTDCLCQVGLLGSDSVCRPHRPATNRDGCSVCNASGLEVLQGVPCVKPEAIPTSAAGRLDLVQGLLNPPKAEDGSQPTPLISKEEAKAMIGAFQGNGTNFSGVDRSVAPPQKMAALGAKSIQEAMLDAYERLKAEADEPTVLSEDRDGMWKSGGKPSTAVEAIEAFMAKGFAPQPDPIVYVSPEEWKLLQRIDAECGPGIAAKDLKPKAPDYSSWRDETDNLPDAEG